MRIIKHLFPTNEEKLNFESSIIVRELWSQAFQIELSEGRNKEHCTSTANEAVDAYNSKFNQVKINLK